MPERLTNTDLSRNGRIQCECCCYFPQHYVSERECVRWDQMDDGRCQKRRCAPRLRAKLHTVQQKHRETQCQAKGWVCITTQIALILNQNHSCDIHRYFWNASKELDTFVFGESAEREREREAKLLFRSHRGYEQEHLGKHSFSLLPRALSDCVPWIYNNTNPIQREFKKKNQQHDRSDCTRGNSIKCKRVCLCVGNPRWQVFFSGRHRRCVVCDALRREKNASPCQAVQDPVNRAGLLFTTVSSSPVPHSRLPERTPPMSRIVHSLEMREWHEKKKRCRA